MNSHTHWDPHQEHDTYENGVHLDPKEKMILLGVVLGMGFLVFLMLIGIGF